MQGKLKVTVDRYLDLVNWNFDKLDYYEHLPHIKLDYYEHLPHIKIYCSMNIYLILN